MVTLFEQDCRSMNRQSSKGNQLKWSNDGFWYKADYAGYEGLAEYLISNLLISSSLSRHEYTIYETDKIQYRFQTYNGCKSQDFLPKGWQLITLERLFSLKTGKSLNAIIYSIKDVEERIRFTAEQTEKLTELPDFGKYLAKMLTIDAFFLNEDRHTHNIAVLLDDTGKYHYCPFFDHGAGLLSDTTMDYPLQADLALLLGNVHSKTFCPDFDEQLDAAENLYGRQLTFSFDRKDVLRLLDQEPY